jgi:hypothetical protein
MAGVGQGIAAAVPQHVGVHREIEASAFAKAFDVRIYCVRRERPAPLGREDEAAIRKLPAKLP